MAMIKRPISSERIIRRKKAFLLRAAVLGVGLVGSIFLAGFAAVKAMQVLRVDAGSDQTVVVSFASSAVPSTASENSQNGEAELKEGGVKAPEFNTNFKQSGEWSLVLVNDKVTVPGSYTPQLVQYDSVQLDARVKSAYLEMRKAASKEGVTLWISSAYRSQESQQELFDAQIKQEQKAGLSFGEAEEKACLSVAKPGHSEHETGLAIDLNGVKENFNTTKEYKWLMSYAAEYGFILRFPPDKNEITGVRFEPWHFRYVGKDAARAIMNKGISLEEYLGFVN